MDKKDSEQIIAMFEAEEKENLCTDCLLDRAFGLVGGKENGN